MTNPRDVAEHAGVTYHIAKRAWETGWPPEMPPISMSLEQERNRHSALAHGTKPIFTPDGRPLIQQERYANSFRKAVVSTSKIVSLLAGEVVKALQAGLITSEELLAMPLQERLTACRQVVAMTESLSNIHSKMDKIQRLDEERPTDIVSLGVVDDMEADAAVVRAKELMALIERYEPPKPLSLPATTPDYSYEKDPAN